MARVCIHLIGEGGSEDARIGDDSQLITVALIASFTVASTAVLICSFIIIKLKKKRQVTEWMRIIKTILELSSLCMIDMLILSYLFCSVYMRKATYKDRLSLGLNDSNQFGVVLTTQCIHQT